MRTVKLMPRHVGRGRQQIRHTPQPTTTRRDKPANRKQRITRKGRVVR